jgi:hypothetical protein
LRCCSSCSNRRFICKKWQINEKKWNEKKEEEEKKKLLSSTFFWGIFLESPKWLEGFCGQFCDWTGLSFDRTVNKKLRDGIINGTPTLLDVRNYLFSRQSQLLLQTNKPWEVEQKSTIK